MDNSIQDQLNRVANSDSKEPETTNTEEEQTQTQDESLKQGTVENQQQTDASSEDTNTATNPDEGKQQEDGGQDPQQQDDSSKKAGQAFAAMRTRLKELEEENKKLKENQAKAGQEQTEQQKKQEPSMEQPKGDETYEELKERLDRTEKYVQQMQMQNQQQKVAQEVQELRDRHALSDDEIYQFADSLEKQGYQIGQGGMTLSQMYTAMNQEKVINDAVERAKKEVMQQQQGTAPKTGPTTSQTGSNKSKPNVNSTLRRVTEKLSN